MTVFAAFPYIHQLKKAGGPSGLWKSIWVLNLRCAQVRHLTFDAQQPAIDMRTLRY